MEIDEKLFSWRIVVKVLKILRFQGKKIIKVKTKKKNMVCLENRFWGSQLVFYMMWLLFNPTKEPEKLASDLVNHVEHIGTNVCIYHYLERNKITMKPYISRS